MPNLRNGTKGGFEPGLTRLQVRHSTTELPRSKTISETKRLRAFNFDSFLCLGFEGNILAEKIIVSYVSVLGINHFDVYGGHFTKWRPFT